MKDDNYTNKVGQFNEAFGILNNKADLYHRLIDEEFQEWFEASMDEEEPEHELKELCDLLYVCFGYALQRGWDISSAFNRVHASNMSKLDANKNPLYNEKGKVIKSELYRAPDLKDLV